MTGDPGVPPSGSAGTGGVAGSMGVLMDETGADEIASQGVVIPEPGPAPRMGQPRCASDADCDADLFCDRGTVCVASLGQFGNDCAGVGDGIHAPCGSYVCVDEICRSCVNDAECAAGESCLDIGDYGKWCAEPKVAEAPANPPTMSGPGSPASAAPVSCEGLDSEQCTLTTSCLWYQGEIYDPAGDCLLAGTLCSERCTSDGALVTFTKSPDGRQWRFSSTCIPQAWPVGVSPTPMALSAFESNTLCLE
jgi:hypothetical protein